MAVFRNYIGYDHIIQRSKVSHFNALQILNRNYLNIAIVVTSTNFMSKR